MPETRFTDFPALSFDPRVAICRPASETDVWLFFLPMALKSIMYPSAFLPFLTFWKSFGVFRSGAKVTSLLKLKFLTSLLTSRVSVPSTWAKQNFPAPLKIEHTIGWERTVHVSRCTALYRGHIFVPICREVLLLCFKILLNVGVST